MDGFDAATSGDAPEQLIGPERGERGFHSRGLDAWFNTSAPRSIPALDGFV